MSYHEPVEVFTQICKCCGRDYTSRGIACLDCLELPIYKLAAAMKATWADVIKADPEGYKAFKSQGGQR